MKIIMKDTKEYGQIFSNENLLADSWFSGVKTVQEASTEGVDYCGPDKMSHKDSFLDTLEKLMKYFPGGSYLVMKSTPTVTGDRPIVAISYK